MDDNRVAVVWRYDSIDFQLDPRTAVGCEEQARGSAGRRNPKGAVVRLAWIARRDCPGSIGFFEPKKAQGGCHFLNAARRESWVIGN